MNKAKQIIMLVIMITSVGLSAQFSVNEDGSSADASAILDVKSSSKGLLLPRMTAAQIATIPDPANGLLVFNTDESRYYVFDDDDNLWKEIEIGTNSVSMPPSIGDYHDGGVVYYIFQSCDPGYVAGETHGLICAISNQHDVLPWYNNNYMVTGATGTAIGTGQTNTSSIISSQGDGYYAAKVCVDYGDGNWFLPSEDELGTIWVNKAAIDSTSIANGGSAIAETWYWSSTEIDATNAYVQDFGFGNPGGSGKEFWTKVRAIRNF